MSLLATILVVVGLWCAASVALACCFSAYRIWCRSDRRPQAVIIPGERAAQSGEPR